MKAAGGSDARQVGWQFLPSVEASSWHLSIRRGEEEAAELKDEIWGEWGVRTLRAVASARVAARTVRPKERTESNWMLAPNGETQGWARPVFWQKATKEKLNDY